MPDPRPDRPGADPEPTADQLRADIEAISELAAAGVEVDGELQIAETTWAVYGHASYDGEVIVGEYHDAAEAEEVLRAAPRAHPDDDRPVQ